MPLSIKNPEEIIQKLGQVIYVAGAQWGDEGKGKLVDILSEKYDIKVNVKGGGMKGQAEAVRLAIARALVKEADSMGLTIEVEQDGQIKTLNEVKYKLKSVKGDMLTRDARVVERKKPGLRKARKKAQFSKR